MNSAPMTTSRSLQPSRVSARIQSVLRRTQRTEPPTRIEHRGGWDVARGRWSTRTFVDLTRNELKILHMLMANHDAIISRQLMVAVAVRCVVDDNTLTVNINRLRKSIGARRLLVMPRAGIRGDARAPTTQGAVRDEPGSLSGAFPSPSPSCAIATAPWSPCSVPSDAWCWRHASCWHARLALTVDYARRRAFYRDLEQVVETQPTYYATALIEPPDS
ncbi:MAG: response regulator transcription factor [Eggerthellaceae bacterium]